MNADRENRILTYWERCGKCGGTGWLLISLVNTGEPLGVIKTFRERQCDRCCGSGKARTIQTPLD